ncbi:hypothetical protein GUITHDRAFT_88180, partial [Guillardia theta CCMP2712]|uniref:Putative thylakoid lumen protein n=2 Tax=Guillardia theta TaxID=55529 RepID=Q5K2R3_GUITH
MLMMRSLMLVAAMLASADAFAYTPSQTLMLRQGASAVSGLKRSSFAVAKPARATALKMQSEDDKAKASGIALAVVGLIFSKFSILVAVLAGGAGVYCAKLPEEGDKGLSDTAKQVSLLIGTYALKAFDFVKQKDAEEGISKKLVEQIKGAVDEAKNNIKQ